MFRPALAIVLAAAILAVTPLAAIAEAGAPCAEKACCCTPASAGCSASAGEAKVGTTHCGCELRETTPGAPASVETALLHEHAPSAPPKASAGLAVPGARVDRWAPGSEGRASGHRPPLFLLHSSLIC
ncbi:MAG: hypothetical protein JSV80_16845 [Acidobacteriota bacterium]|nr:MAG: hypothetical protein JSV80_16845 [Acidobacteriota bacterium]